MSEKPIRMVLHCPRCHMQHIDAPEEHDALRAFTRPATPWANPPHRSHLCLNCGCIWRPADVPTEGVEAVQTKGANDSPLPPVRYNVPYPTKLSSGETVGWEKS